MQRPEARHIGAAIQWVNARNREHLLSLSGSKKRL